MAFDKQYYDDKKKALATRLNGKKDIFIKKVFEAAQELSQEQEEIIRDIQEIIKIEEENKQKEETKDSNTEPEDKSKKASPKK